MEDVDAKVQEVVEKLLGNEQLTAELDDGEATILLDWGINLATKIAIDSGTMNESKAQVFLTTRTKALRHLLRGVSQWITQERYDSEFTTKQIRIIYKNAAIVYGWTSPETETIDESDKVEYLCLGNFGWEKYANEVRQVSGNAADRIRDIRLITEANFASSHFQAKLDGTIDDPTKKQE